ncbi:M23 family metallopeptidase [Arthrobacter sp. L77]|uniref:M23 family metallopeptidase n=1 Tax=Arthrobacter sp. L77 TaxID=1496689 RepID=UPI0009E40D64|nr:M23 family metallopeptidase [Arthrobacter sp. L77]
MPRPPDLPAPRPRRRRAGSRGHGVRGHAVRAVVVALLAVLLGVLPGADVPPPASAAASSAAPASTSGVGEGTGPAPFVPEWSWPLEPVPDVLRPFERPPQTWERGHRGVDLSAGAGGPVPVVSPADGVVSFAGTVVDRGVLSIDHGGGRISSFEPVSTELSRGVRVARGQVVATLDARSAPGPARGPGRVHCRQPCLHWGVREDGEYVDPLSFVTDRRPSVLLPLGGA